MKFTILTALLCLSNLTYAQIKINCTLPKVKIGNECVLPNEQPRKDTITFTKSQWLSLSCLSADQKQNYYLHELAAGVTVENAVAQLNKFDEDCAESKR